ncbi:MAG: 30S ribosomal protein S4e [Candidatus Woesearchaeota archaeon]
MVKQHLKRLASPRTWGVKKKGITFITRPNPGPHKIDLQMPINVILRDLLSIVKSTKETKFILHNKDCLIDGKICSDYRRPAGLMDVISIPSRNESYRILINKKNKLYTLPIQQNESLIKIVKIKSKVNLKKGKIQLNCTDGRNILVDDSTYKINDSLVIELPSQKITQVLPFEKGSMILLTSGAHVGETGLIEEIKESKLVVKSDNNTFTTKKEFAFVIGKSSPVIKL